MFSFRKVAAAASESFVGPPVAMSGCRSAQIRSRQLVRASFVLA
jgi:hypothetical protein